MKKGNDRLTGGRRMELLLESGMVDRGGQYIDTYNQCVFNGYSGTIKARIDQNNMYFVTVIENEEL